MCANCEILDDGDELAGLFGGDTVAAAPRAVTAPEWFKPATERAFTEACKRCGGSGSYGRFGTCFACKGKGTQTFKTSRDERARNRAGAQARKERNAADAIEAFKAAHPEAHAWLVAQAYKDRPFDFAVSMLEAVRKWGALTDNQLAAVVKLMGRDEQRADERKARVEAAPAITVERIEKAFSDARAAGLKKHLKLRLDTFVFSPAGASSKNPGAIYVKEGNDYLGKVVAGKFHAVRTCGDERAARIVAAAADPEAAAVAYGKRTGTCSCCGAELTNAESIERGIGPICAEKWGW